MITKEEFFTLRDFIYEKTGIFFAENKTYLLESRLTNRLGELGLSSFEDYYYCLKYGSDKAKDEMANLFDVVTTNETSFFRNPPQLDAFKIVVQKNYLNGNGLSPIKIWSAACSTGEEPYTLAIIMEELIQATKQTIPYIIYATDISQKVLESAKRAVFSQYSTRNTNELLRKKYFIEEKNMFKLHGDIKKKVKIDFMNLMDGDAYRVYKQMDIIFCRNVLIYFDEKVKKEGHRTSL